MFLDDGVVRIWSGYDDPTRVELMTAFRCLPIDRIIAQHEGVRLVLAWQQQNGLLVNTRHPLAIPLSFVSLSITLLYLHLLISLSLSLSLLWFYCQSIL